MERTQITVKISDEAIERAISSLEISRDRELSVRERVLKGKGIYEGVERILRLMDACERSTKSIDYSIVVY